MQRPVLPPNFKVSITVPQAVKRSRSGTQLERKSGFRTVQIGPEMLTPREAMFLGEYVKDFNVSQALMRSGVASSTAAKGDATWFFNRAHCMAALHYELQMRRDRLNADADEVVRYWHALATADAREFNTVYARACRFCHGIDNRYQFTQNELRDIRLKHQTSMQTKPDALRYLLDEMGGDGYDRTREPNPHCAECNGMGILQVEHLNLDKLSYGASLLFDGMKVSANGTIEYKFRDRSRAMENYQQLMGFVRPRRMKLDFNFDEIPDEQLDALLSEAHARGLLRPEDYGQKPQEQRTIEGTGTIVTPDDDDALARDNKVA